MAIFIDGHDMKNLTKEQLLKLIDSPADEFGIQHKELFFNEKKNRLFCVLEAPTKESIYKHHHAAGLKCDFVTEVNQIQRDMLLKSEKMEIIGELADRLTNDLRNPLSAIKNITDIIKKRNSNLNEETLENLKIINDIVLKMTHQIHDVLDFVKNKQLTLGNNSLAVILKRTVDTIMIPDTVDVSLPKNDISLMCDFEKIKSVFTNMIINSIQAINYNGTINIRIIEKDSFVFIEFEDQVQTYLLRYYQKYLIRYLQQKRLVLD